tara:strand:+ start:325 stop:588 length:264 start_codon:yes stop_codon:yes gene_type:complete
MGVIIKNRTIRPSTRNANSSYRVRVANAKPDDEIVIFIDHESMDYRAIYKCSGGLFQESDSIHFKVEMDNGEVLIKWGGNKEPERVR